MASSTEKQQIFRQAALDRLSSPEQLDQLMQVTTPRGWIALAAGVIVILAALAWGLYGSIPTKVSGSGVLLKEGGVQEVMASGSGIISELLCQTGGMVKKGDIVARIAQPEIGKQISDTLARLEEVDAQQRIKGKFAAENLRLQMDLQAKERERLLAAVKTARERKEWLAEKMASQQALFEQGLVTRQAVLSTRERLEEAESRIKDEENQLRQLDVKEHELKNQVEQELLAGEIQINETRRSLAALEERLSHQSEVVSPYTGQVLEMRVSKGDPLRDGMPLFTMEPMESQKQTIVAILYLSFQDGKKVRPGMRAQISPSTVKREEYGFIVGTVRTVSEFPATREGMMRTLANEQLVGTLTQDGAPIAITAELSLSPETVSGFEWSSSQGPPVLITSGTFCTATVTVRQQRPISLVIPILKKSLGL
ncbi:MAG: NHLP bacteriocin system secretion protein [Pseudomonadota bacterium]